MTTEQEQVIFDGPELARQLEAVLKGASSTQSAFAEALYTATTYLGRNTAAALRAQKSRIISLEAEVASLRTIVEAEHR